MTIRELKEFIANSNLTDDSEVLVFNRNIASLDDVESACKNGKCLQLNIIEYEVDENDD